MSTDTMVLDAVLTLAERELARSDWPDRAGAVMALLIEAVPFLRELREKVNAEVTA